jgi:hypothetical protein
MLRCFVESLAHLTANKSIHSWKVFKYFYENLWENKREEREEYNLKLNWQIDGLTDEKYERKKTSM